MLDVPGHLTGGTRSPAARPTVRPALVANDTGYLFWDATLGKLMHWSGAAWDV